MILNPVIIFTLAILCIIYFWYSFRYYDRSLPEVERDSAAAIMSKVSLGIFSTIIIYMVLNIAYYIYMSTVFTASVSKYQVIGEIVGNILTKL